VEALTSRKGEFMPAAKTYPKELKDRAMRLVEDLLADPEVKVSVAFEGAGRMLTRLPGCG